MSSVFFDNVATSAGFEGLRQAFLKPVMTVQPPEDERAGSCVEVFVKETSPAGLPVGKEFVFRVFSDGQVMVWADLGEDLSEVIESVKEHVRYESGCVGFPYPADWVLDDEEAEADLEALRESAERGDASWVRSSDYLG